MSQRKDSAITTTTHGKGLLRRTVKSIRFPVDLDTLEAFFQLMKSPSGDYVRDYLTTVQEAADKWLRAKGIALGDGAALKAYAAASEHARRPSRAEEFNELAMLCRACARDYAAHDSEALRRAVFLAIRIEDLRWRMNVDADQKMRGQFVNLKRRELAIKREENVRQQ